MTEERGYPNDPDTRLARDIGQSLEAGSPDPASADPLIPALNAYRVNAEKDLRTSAVRQERLWQQIEQKSRPKASRLSLVRWAAGIAATLLVLLGGWYYVFRASPTLIAESAGSTLVHTLEDGSTVTLRPYSKLRQLSREKDRVVLFLTGEAYFDVVSVAGRQFTVSTPLATVTVVGTRFNVSTWANTTHVYLDDGQVEVVHLDVNTRHILSSGESAVASEAGLVLTSAGQEARYLDWMSNEVQFQQLPASDIAAELEQHFNTSITLPDSLQNTTLSGGILLSSETDAVRDFGRALGGKFVKERAGTYSFR